MAKRRRLNAKQRKTRKRGIAARRIKRRTSARAQSRQILTNRRKLNRLLDRVNNDSAKLSLKYEGHIGATPESTLQFGPNPICLPCCPAVNTSSDTSVNYLYPAWSYWGFDNQNAKEAPSVRFHRIHCVFNFVAADEPNRTTITFFHLRLKEKMAEDFRSVHGEALGMSTGATPMVDGQHYLRGNTNESVADDSVSPSLRAHVVWNPEFFDIKKRWSFQLVGGSTTQGQPPQTLQNTTPFMKSKTIKYSFTHNGVLRNTIGNQVWTTCSADAHYNYDKRDFFVFFTDNLLDKVPGTDNPTAPKMCWQFHTTCTAKV